MPGPERGANDHKSDSRLEAALRGPETGPGRPPVDRKRTLEDVRPDVRAAARDATRTKARRHLTKAQRAARDRSGNAKVRGPAPTRERNWAQKPADRAKSTPAARARDRVQPEPRWRSNDRELSAEALEREPHYLHGREISLSRAQAEVLNDLGRFRVARPEAIEQHVYAGNPLAKDQIGELKRARLVQEHATHTGQRYLSLTKTGRALAQDMQTDPRQELYSGIKRLPELKHDSAVYEAYQHARQGIEAEGNRVTLVHLDYELKRDVGREAYILAARELRAEHKHIQVLPKEERQAAIKRAAVPVATARDLPADDNGVDYPDLQIEYERPDGTIGRVNVEIVTENYKAADLAAKSGAGFQLYLPADSQGARQGAPRGIHSLAEDVYDF